MWKILSYFGIEARKTRVKKLGVNTQDFEDLRPAAPKVKLAPVVGCRGCFSCFTVTSKNQRVARKYMLNRRPYSVDRVTNSDQKTRTILTVTSIIHGIRKESDIEVRPINKNDLTLEDIGENKRDTTIKSEDSDEKNVESYENHEDKVQSLEHRVKTEAETVVEHSEQPTIVALREQAALKKCEEPSEDCCQKVLITRLPDVTQSVPHVQSVATSPEISSPPRIDDIESRDKQESSFEIYLPKLLKTPKHIEECSPFSKTPNKEDLSDSGEDDDYVLEMQRRYGTTSAITLATVDVPEITHLHNHFREQKEILNSKSTSDVPVTRTPRKERKAITEHMFGDEPLVKNLIFSDVAPNYESAATKAAVTASTGPCHEIQHNQSNIKHNTRLTTSPKDSKKLAQKNKKVTALITRVKQLLDLEKNKKEISSNQKTSNTKMMNVDKPGSSGDSNIQNGGRSCEIEATPVHPPPLTPLQRLIRMKPKPMTELQKKQKSYMFSGGELKKLSPNPFEIQEPLEEATTSSVSVLPEEAEEISSPVFPSPWPGCKRSVLPDTPSTIRLTAWVDTMPAIGV